MYKLSVHNAVNRMELRCLPTETGMDGRRRVVGINDNDQTSTENQANDMDEDRCECFCTAPNREIS